MGFNYNPLRLGNPLGLGLGLRLRLGLRLVLWLGLSWDDLDDHFRRLQPTDPNSNLPGITHLDQESRVSDHYPLDSDIYPLQDRPITPGYRKQEYSILFIYILSPSSAHYPSAYRLL